MNERYYIGLVIVSVAMGVAFAPLEGFLVLGTGFMFDGLLTYLNKR